MGAPPSLVWFRQDLRLDDNPALLSAVEQEGPVVPVYIWSPEEEGDWPPGAASRWWLHRSLQALDDSLRKAGIRLILRKGKILDELRRLIRETGANAVFWNRRYEPEAIQRDTKIKATLDREGITVRSFNAALLFEPQTVLKDDGGPYRVFTPFWKACLSRPEPAEPIPAPTRLPGISEWPESIDVDDLHLEPEIDWAVGLRETWTPGEKGARDTLDRFLEEALLDYAHERERPDHRGTSRLSPYLHFGEISPRRAWHSVHRRVADEGQETSRGANAFLRELGWREFSYSMLFHFPHTVDAPLQEKFEAFPWRRDDKGLRAWQKGKTGYPLVDAGMRELWRIGWMHNRVRMVVASFLVKHLGIHWRTGAEWFWDTLVDADLANNTMGWQWTAGSGADAAPYFRIFNPTSQAKKFDPEGTYIGRWVPELKNLPVPQRVEPWGASEEVLGKAEVRLDETYPRPIVDHAEARDRALEAFKKIKGK